MIQALYLFFIKIVRILIGSDQAGLMSNAVLDKFYDEKVGSSYHLNRQKKEELVKKFIEIHQKIPSGTSWLTNVVLATEILRISPKIKGDIIECGCWKGASTAGLSLICKIVKRKLIVADSFEGLPEDDKKVIHQYPHVGVYGFYKEGMYSARLEEVQDNIAKYGDISVCEFLPGFFTDSLKSIKKPIAFAFLDVDLALSMKDCIKYIWPKLINDGFIYTDDSCDMEVVKIWFDNQWWGRTLKQSAPGYVGSGCGLPINPNFSALGYSLKIENPQKSYGRISWLVYPDDKIKKTSKKK